MQSYTVWDTSQTYPDACQDGDVRLVDGQSAYEGRVEVCIGQRWGTVCNTGWSTEDSEVVCQQLGYPPTGTWQTEYCILWQSMCMLFNSMQYCHVVIL